MSDQIGWRYCANCSVLFYDGYRENKGVCPHGGGHASIGWKFTLTWVPPEQQVADTLTSQAQWRYCGNCNALFYDGDRDHKGVCPHGGGHQHAGWQFILPRDMPATPTMQPAWRYCGNCNSMFYDGYRDNKGVCPHGGGHVSIGSNFLLPHPITPTLGLVDGGSEVRVVGFGFTPFSVVTIDWGCETPGLDGVTHTTREQFAASADHDGDLPPGTHFTVPARAFNIGARAVDEVTGQAAEAATLRPAVG